MRLHLMLILSAIAFTLPSFAQDEVKVPITGEARKELAVFDKMMADFVAVHELPGAALAITKDGKLVYARGFGHADKEEGTLLLPAALFRIASISKPITAVAIMQLAEKGKLRLSDKVVDVLKVEPAGRKPDERWRQVTILHLLQHTGGWDRKVSFDPMFRPGLIAKELDVLPPAKSEHVIRYMLSMPFDFNPGARYAYSNFGYCLLGRVIEQVSGERYEDYVRKHVLAPVGITSMRIGHSRLAERAEHEVKYYAAGSGMAASVFPGEKDVLVPYGSFYLEAMDSHGGWIASAPDLVRFASAFDDPQTCRILKATSIEQMFAPPTSAEKKDFYYGCGWQVRVVANKSGRNTFHTGALPGTSTILVRRHDGLNWAVLFNGNSKTAAPPASVIDGLVHQAADTVKVWPGALPN